MSDTALSPVDVHKQAWTVVSRDIFSWFLFFGVFFFAFLFTCGVGTVLIVNVLREARAAVEEERGPRIGGLFQMDRIGADCVAVLLYIVPFWLGGASGGLLSAAIGIALVLFFPLVVEGRHDPIDCAKLSLRHVMKYPGEHILFFFVSWILGSVGSMFIITIPIVFAMREVAQWLWYKRFRDELIGMAEADGLRRIDIRE